MPRFMKKYYSEWLSLPWNACEGCFLFDDHLRSYIFCHCAPEALNNEWKLLLSLKLEFSCNFLAVRDFTNYLCFWY